MRQFILIVVVLVSCAFSSSAQSGLKIENIFNGKYSSDPKVTETLMSGQNKFLKSHKLSVFATFKGPASTYQSKIEPLVISDGAGAIGKNVRYKEGKLYFALYILKPVSTKSGKMNRYLYYLNNAANKGSNILVVYLEGSLSEAEVAGLIQSMATNAK